MTLGGGFQAPKPLGCTFPLWFVVCAFFLFSPFIVRDNYEKSTKENKRGSDQKASSGREGVVLGGWGTPMALEQTWVHLLSCNQSSSRVGKPGCTKQRKRGPFKPGKVPCLPIPGMGRKERPKQWNGPGPTLERWPASRYGAAVGYGLAMGTAMGGELGTEAATSEQQQLMRTRTGPGGGWPRRCRRRGVLLPCWVSTE